jgi:lipid A 3-O-deacylase
MLLKGSLLFVLLFFGILSALEKSSDSSHLMLGLGCFNICKEKRKFQYQAEYRRKIAIEHLKPLISFSGTTKGSIFLCGGIAYDLFLGKYLILTPSFAPGFYFKGKGKDLGSVLEFRSSIELALPFQNRGRIGMQFYHISNASLGYKNPGEESLIFFYALPLN